MDDPDVVWKFTLFFVKPYIPFLKYACMFSIPFRGIGVLTLLYSKEKCTCNQLDDGCVQMGVSFLVYVNHYLGWYSS